MLWTGNTPEVHKKLERHCLFGGSIGLCRNVTSGSALDLHRALGLWAQLGRPPEQQLLGAASFDEIILLALVL